MTALFQGIYEPAFYEHSLGVDLWGCLLIGRLKLPPGGNDSHRLNRPLSPAANIPSIDERDARDIAKHEDVDEDEVEQSNTAAKEVQVSKQVSVYASCIMKRAHDSTGSSSYCRQLSRCVGGSE